MIPLKLSLKGIYSYREQVDIDFSKLIEAGLFGIFGPVGSGKSAILEAIGFALFGETERLGSREKSGGRAYNMMNLRSDELHIDFSFRQEGPLAGEYRFVVRQKRNKKKFGDAGSPDRIAYLKKGDEYFPLDPAV